jgi:uncharacterized membrane protein YczE
MALCVFQDIDGTIKATGTAIESCTDLVLISPQTLSEIQQDPNLTEDIAQNLLDAGVTPEAILLSITFGMGVIFMMMGFGVAVSSGQKVINKV